VGRLELRALATRVESRVKNYLEAVMASVQRNISMKPGGVISVHKIRVLAILRPPTFPTKRVLAPALLKLVNRTCKDRSCLRLYRMVRC
jgi:hypothetical protein